MNRIAQLLLLVLLAGLSVSGQQSTLLWDYDTASDRLCSATVTDSCVKEFEIVAIGDTETVLGRVPASVCVLQSGTLFTCSTPSPVTKYGTTTIAVRAIAKEGTAEVASVNSNTIQKERRPRPPVAK